MTWTPVALAADIAPGTSTGAVLEGAELVLWRDTAGILHAWEDRCPHRGMRLSFGFVKGDRIACLYHGWEYDAGARCRYIPAHPDLEVPASIRVNTNSVAVARGMVWVATVPDPGPAPAGADAAAVRSLWADVPVAGLAAALAGGLPGLGPAQVTGDGALRRIEQGGHVLWAGLHPVTGAASALHLTVEGAADPDTRVALSAAAEALRRAVEPAEAA